MDPTQQPHGDDSGGVEPSEPDYVTTQEATPEPVGPPADTTLEATPEPVGPPADATRITAPETGGPQLASPADQSIPQYGASPIVAEPDQAQAQPSQASAFERHRTVIVLGTVAALVLVIVLVGVVAVLSQPASTLTIRAIVPAPAVAGGLANDVADDSSPQFQAGLAQFRQRYVAGFAQHISSYTAAIYTNAAAGQPANTASVGVLYIGVNLAGDPIDPSTAVSSSIGRIEKSIHVSVSTVHVSGLPGDTSAECIGTTASGRPVAVCVWATDKTVSLIATVIPGTDLELASVLKKMRPDLQRG